MVNMVSVENVAAAISRYESYTRLLGLVTLALIIVLFLQWIFFNIPYAFASITGIAARTAIKNYNFSQRSSLQNETVKLKKKNRTKYKNFIIRQEILMAAELPKELKAL